MQDNHGPDGPAPIAEARQWLHDAAAAGASGEVIEAIEHCVDLVERFEICLGFDEATPDEITILQEGLIVESERLRLLLRLAQACVRPAGTDRLLVPKDEAERDVRRFRRLAARSRQRVRDIGRQHAHSHQRQPRRTREHRPGARRRTAASSRTSSSDPGEPGEPHLAVSARWGRCSANLLQLLEETTR